MMINHDYLLLVAKSIGIVAVFFYIARIVAKLLSARIAKKPKFAKQLLRYTGNDCFGKVLSIHHHITGDIDLQPGANILRFHMRVPSSLCTVARHGHLALDLGAILALADEITTVLIVCSDSSYRPGVSVSLSGELLCDDIRAGQIVEIEAHILKIGKTLGFTEMYVMSSDAAHTTLARASHTKYLVMGAIWDILAPFIPLLASIYLHYSKHATKPRTDTKESLDEILNLSEVSITSPNVRSLALLPTISARNLFGAIHGGALSMAIDRAAVVAAPAYAVGAKVRKLEISYLSPASKHLTISITQLALVESRRKHSHASDAYVTADSDMSLRVVIRPVALKSKKSTGGELRIALLLQDLDPKHVTGGTTIEICWLDTFFCVSPASSMEEPMEIVSSITAEEETALRSLVEKVYSLPSSAEFRRPVLLAYPDLAKSYLQAISTPMDLGTVISKLQKKAYKSKQEVSSDIALVFNNSMSYNTELIHMVSMSRHLLSYASLLWSEMIDTSHLPDAAARPAMQNTERRAEERRQRLDTIREEALFPDEVTSLRDVLEQLVTAGDSSIPYQTCAAICNAHLRNEADATALTSLTLAEALQPIVFHYRALYLSRLDVQALSQGSLASFPVFLVAELSQDVENISSSILSSLQLPPSLTTLDKFINLLSVDVLERCCRGNVVSSVWAKPGKIVWAQPTKSPWWPGMIIAAGSNVHDEYSFPPLLSAANISRLPEDIVADLMKLRPRGNSQSHVPPQRIIPATYGNNIKLQEALMAPGAASYVLIEFFGSHDFGWIRPECLFDFPPDGALHIPAAKRSSTSSEKGTQDSATLLEARETYEWLKAPPAPRDIFTASHFENIDVEVPESTLAMKDAVDDVPMTAAPPPKKKSRRKKAEDFESRPVSENKRKEACARSRELSRWLQAQQPVLALTSGRGRTPAVAGVLSEGASILPPTPAIQSAEWVPPPAFIFGDSVQVKQVTPAKSTPKSEGANSTVEISPSGVADDVKHWATVEDIDFSGTFPISCSTLVSSRGTETARNCGYAGASILHCRRVNLNSSLFHLESKSREERKKILQDEISKLKADIQALQDTQKSKKALASDLESITTEAKLRHEQTSPVRKPIVAKNTPPVSRKRNSSKISGIATAVNEKTKRRVENGASTPPPKATPNADKSTGSDVKSSSSDEVASCSVIYSSAMSMMPF